MASRAPSQAGRQAGRVVTGKCPRATICALVRLCSHVDCIIVYAAFVASTRIHYIGIMRSYKRCSYKYRSRKTNILSRSTYIKNFNKPKRKLINFPQMSIIFFFKRGTSLYIYTIEIFSEKYCSLQIRIHFSKLSHRIPFG